MMRGTIILGIRDTIKDYYSLQSMTVVSSCEKHLLACMKIINRQKSTGKMSRNRSFFGDFKDRKGTS